MRGGGWRAWGAGSWRLPDVTRNMVPGISGRKVCSVPGRAARLCRGSCLIGSLQGWTVELGQLRSLGLQGATADIIPSEPAQIFGLNAHQHSFTLHVWSVTCVSYSYSHVDIHRGHVTLLPWTLQPVITQTSPALRRPSAWKMPLPESEYMSPTWRDGLFSMAPLGSSARPPRPGDACSPHPQRTA